MIVLSLPLSCHGENLRGPCRMQIDARLRMSAKFTACLDPQVVARPFTRADSASRDAGALTIVLAL